jgi:hypothetical protein
LQKKLGVIFSPKKLKNFLTASKALNSSLSFERNKIDGKFRQSQELKRQTEIEE